MSDYKIDGFRSAFGVRIGNNWASHWGPGGPPQAHTPRQEIEQLRAELDHLAKQLERVNESSTGHAVVLAIRGEKVLIRAVAGTILTGKPPFPVARGQIVVVRQEGQIVAPEHEPPGYGQMCKVVHVAGDNVVELDAGFGNARRVLCACPVEVGDRVILDSTGSAVMANVGREQARRVFSEPTGVTWDDVGGQEEAKLALREAIEEPHLHRDAYRMFGKKPARGILLYGRPGNGKTMLAKAAATAVAELHGGNAGGYAYVKGPELLNRFVGESEAAVRNLFEGARQHHAEHGYPMVVLIDEADALLGRRGGRSVDGMELTVVPQFLAEMDGLASSSALFLLLTNRPDSLDPAVVRDGRVDRRVHVGQPTESDAADIIARCLRGRPVVQGTCASELGEIAARELYSGKDPLYIVRTKSGQDRRVGLESLASGAMCAGIVERATQAALRRHIADRSLELGITEGDVLGAVRASREEMRATDHTAEVLAVVAELGDDAVKIERAK